MESTAQEIARLKKNMKRSNDYNPTIDRLSIEQKKYKMQIELTKEVEKVKELRNKRNQAIKKIRKEIKNWKQKKIDDITNMIQKEKESEAMFKVLKQLKTSLKKRNKIIPNQMRQSIINKKDQNNERN